MLRKSLAFVVVALLLAAGASAQSVGLVLSGEEECNDDKSERFAQHISKNL